MTWLDRGGESEFLEREGEGEEDEVREDAKRTLEEALRSADDDDDGDVAIYMTIIICQKIPKHARLPRAPY